MPESDIGELEQISVFAEWLELGDCSRRSLERAGLFADALGLFNHLERVRLLGVVGSKGKGTAAIYASAALSAGSHRVGTITSPGLRSNRDRVRLDGSILSDRQYREMLARIHEARSQLDLPTPNQGYLSINGLFMLGGLEALIRAGCEAVVLEAGIGGGSDELSLLPLDVVVMTKIFMEHRAILGPTLAAIAGDKAAVVTRRTEEVWSLGQSPEVAAEVEVRCRGVGTKLSWVNSVGGGNGELSRLPPYIRMNAIVGINAGSALSRIMDRKAIEPTALTSVLSTVFNPGRMSEHSTPFGKVIVDSAITRDALVRCLFHFRFRFGRDPDTLLLSLPMDKDFEGFKTEAAGYSAAKVFINLPNVHLDYPSRSDWPWEWATTERLPELLHSRGLILAVGTALFTGEVLSALNIDADSVFRPNLGGVASC